MNFLTGITNLTSWMGKRHHANARRLVLRAWRPPLCAWPGAHLRALGGFPLLMVSGVLRGIEKFAAQAAWNNPDLVWITMRGMVYWTCNVFLPVYAVLQLLHGFMQYAGDRSIVCTPAAPGCGISARLHCAWHCPACCGWRNGSSPKGLAALAEGGTRNVMALNISPVHRNLHTRVSFLYLEFEDWFVVIGLAALTNISAGGSIVSCSGYQ